jgi:hypothetical protein
MTETAISACMPPACRGPRSQSAFRLKGAGEGEPDRADWPSGADLEDLHQLLKEIGLAPHFGGMRFVKIRGKGYMWVSKEEAEAFAEENIPIKAHA